MQTLIIFILLIFSHSLLALSMWLILKNTPPKPKHSAKEGMEGEIKKLNTILKNIEVYDGSPKGQIKP